MTGTFVPADQFFKRHKRDRFKVRCKGCQGDVDRDPSHPLLGGFCSTCALKRLQVGLADLLDPPEEEETDAGCD